MENVIGDRGSDREPPTRDEWAPEFPHRALDKLAKRLENADDLEPTDAAELVRLVAREAQRLRSTVVRLSMEKLSTADREAQMILQDALKRADDLKALGLSTLEQRLDEADELLVGLRSAFHTELGAARAAATRRPGRGRPTGSIADDGPEVPR